MYHMGPSPVRRWWMVDRMIDGLGGSDILGLGLGLGLESEIE